MRKILTKAGVLLTISIGSLLGMIKGPEAKQKWAFRIKSRNDERKQQKMDKQLAQNGGVLLDEIEIASYHRG
ncbi:MAG: hypothetical protein RL732_283 [Bacteroidota bacterium]|jgi:hypothetical protein